ncbi:MAG: aminotransferase class V-fold PLP-dependent enzyme, partial [Actinophytocola sp.]|nr:aminotransferase class V-fold PLP-dependent enzyme [Actinophytocola sp.]
GQHPPRQAPAVRGGVRAYESTRIRVAEFIGARAGEVVFVRNTTEAVSMIAHGLGLKAADVLVTTLDAHHSNMLPWRRHGETVVVPLDDDAGVDLDGYRTALEHGPALVALTACSNVTGHYAPITSMVKLAKDAGAVVVVDAAQYAPHRGGMEGWGADFVAFSGHKMLGPSGVGVLWGRQKVLEGLAPYALGGGTVDWVDTEGERLRKLPHRLEYGTPDVAGVIGLGAAVGYLESLGMDRVAEHDRAMAERLREESLRRDRLTLLGNDDPDGDYAGIISFAVAGEARLDHVARALSDSYGVMCRSGHMCSQP